MSEAYEKASKLFEVPLESVVQWIDALSRFNKLDEGIKVLDNALDKHKGSVDLWKYKLKLWIDFEKSQEEILILFENALAQLKPKETFQLWDLVLKWCIQIDSDKTEAFFKVYYEIFIN